ncbi:cysteine hydrolase family protein [Polaromonas sp.]|uniref:cysteine hydrolase family protein n=1 Tax=Polaromonas sp. TaxID=1869339 RepID=UPI00352AF4F1
MSPAKDSSLAPDRATGGQALLVIDMISCWDFPDAGKLLPAALGIAPSIVRFAQRCRKTGVPVIYVNDNMGRWRSDFNSLIQMALESDGAGATIASVLRPQAADYFVLKPKHSAFHATPLTLLLSHLGVQTVFVAGVSSDQCVMTSVAEARMWDLEVVVPRDLVASQSARRNTVACRQFENVYGLRTTASKRIRLKKS